MTHKQADALIGQLAMINLSLAQLALSGLKTDEAVTAFQEQFEKIAKEAEDL